MDKHLHEQLKQMKEHASVRPDTAWVDDTRASLMQTIEASQASKQLQKKSLLEKMSGFFGVFIPQQMHRGVQLGAGVMAVVMVAIGGWSISVQASQDSLPGDWLYSVKLAGERTQIAMASVTGNEEAETKLHLKSAKKRSEELTRVKESVQAQQVLENLKKSTESAERSLAEIKLKDGERAEVVAKEVATETEEISKTLKEVSKKVAVTDVSVSKEVNETRKEVDETSLEAVTALDPEEAKVVVEKKIAAALEETQEVKQVVVMVSTTQSMVTSTPQVAPTSTTGTSVQEDTSSTVHDVSAVTSTEGVSSTLEVDATSTEAIEEPVQPISVKEVDASLSKVDQLAAEAKELLAQNNVEEAVQKVRAIREINSGSEDAILQLQSSIKQQQENQEKDAVEKEVEEEPVTVPEEQVTTTPETPAESTQTQETTVSQ